MRRTMAIIALMWAASPLAAQVTGLDHVGIQASDLDRSAAFYADVLGLTEIASPLPRNQVRWFKLGAGQLHIVAGGHAGAERNKWDHFALACADLPAMVARLDRLHVAWADMSGAHALQRRPDGVTQLFVFDPEGYHIELSDAPPR